MQQPQQEKRPHRRRFFFRTLTPPDDNDYASSQELQLLTATDLEKDASTGCSLIFPHDNEDDDYSSGSSDSSGSSLSTIAELQQQQQEVVLLGQTEDRLRVFPTEKQRQESASTLQQYVAKREMTPRQERWNALTMIPSPIYCIYFLLSGCWLKESLVEETRQEMMQQQLDSLLVQQVHGFEDFANNAVGDVHGCLSDSSLFSSWLFLQHHMPALPPMTVVAVAIGIICHAPFSFLYHYKYAHSLAGTSRTTHWSRRMDQSMIHFGSACVSYATSGSWDYFVANVLFNLECCVRQFQHKVRPRRNQIRIGISIIFYVLPILRRGDLELFLQVMTVVAVGGWLFILYPIGGWSHTAFHLVLAFLPPLLMMAATELPASQEQLRLAATCAVLAEQQQ